MKAKADHIIIGAGAVIAGVVIYGMIQHHNADIIVAQVNSILDSGSSTGANLVAVDQTTLPSAQFPLAIGTVGTQVYDVQKAMNKKYAAQLQLNGTMDEATMEAICKYYSDICFFGVGADLLTLSEPDYATMMSW